MRAETIAKLAHCRRGIEAELKKLKALSRPTPERKPIEEFAAMIELIETRIAAGATWAEATKRFNPFVVADLSEAMRTNYIERFCFGWEPAKCPTCGHCLPKLTGAG